MILGEWWRRQKMKKLYFKHAIYTVLIIILCTISFISGAWSIDNKFLIREFEFATSRNLGEDYDNLKRYSDSIDEWDLQYMVATDSIIYCGNKLIMGGPNLENREELLEIYLSNIKKILDLYKR